MENEDIKQDQNELESGKEAQTEEIENPRIKHLKVIRTSERGRELGSRPKKNTKKMSWSKKMYWLKKKGASDESCQFLYDMISDEDVTDTTILEYIGQLKKYSEESNDPKELKAVIDLLIKWRKERFGKIRVEGKIDVDWNSDVNRILKACDIIDAEVVEESDEDDS